MTSVSNGRRVAIMVVLCVLTSLSSGCTGLTSGEDGPPPGNRMLGQGLAGGTAHGANVAAGSLTGDTTAPVAPHLEFGRSTPGVDIAGGKPIGIEPGGRRMTLQFVNTELQEFIRSVFEEILQEPVIVDPNVAGRITVRTGEPVDRAEAVELVRQMLALNGAELSREGKVWRVGARQGGQAKPFGNVRIVPLHNIEPEQARAALQGLVGSSVALVAAPGTRSLIFSGNDADVQPLIDLLAALDVDGMSGQSFGLLPLKEAGAASVAKDLVQVFAEAGRSFQAIPISRMNAILVIASTPTQLVRARGWVMRLDRETKPTGQVYVYPVQNRRASDLAAVLRKMFRKGDQGGAAAGEASGGVSPGFGERSTGDTSRDGKADASAPSRAAAATPTERLEAAFADTDPGSTGKDGVSIEADAATNSLVVTAPQDEWRTISAAIGRLDIQPTQVLIEATIAEVRLNDTLKHGVRWYFEAGYHTVSSTDAINGAVSPNVAGGNYTFSVPSAKVIISALEDVTDVDVVSSPALTVLDNQTATLKVGDQVPIATRSAQSISTPDAPVVNDIQLKDTGVILSVTPRVNAGGLVQLEISQEVSDVVATTTSAIDSPTIRLRKIDSSVAVASGQEIVLGGLIGSRREKTESGVPFLKDIPVLGTVFKTSASRTADRSELLIILRPTIMANRADIDAVTRAVRAGMPATSRAIGR